MSNEKMRCCFCGKEVSFEEACNPMLHSYSEELDNLLASLDCCKDCDEHIVFPTRVFIHSSKSSEAWMPQRYSKASE